MNSYTLHPPPERVSPIEVALQETEQLLGVRFTLHDLAGIFVDAEGRPLSGRWRGSHRRYQCCASDYCKLCLQHCYQAVNRRAATRSTPFLHRCWKGLLELALPLRRDGVHVGTLFAGQWRARKRKVVPGHLKAATVSAIRRLPGADSTQLDRLGTVLATWAAGLLEQAQATRQTNGSTLSRKAAIYRYLELRAAEPIRLADMARTLHLSPSRTSHLIRELTGSNFQTLLTTERLRKARTLLRSTDLTVAEIGHLAGINDAGYFSRLFHLRTGLSPGAWRRTGPVPKKTVP